jgi:hypothetical protein
MRNTILAALLSVVASSAAGNEIYISQIGDNLDLDIVQAGNGNRIGDIAGTTPVTLNGDDMTFSITQTGDNNTIDAIINGNTYTGTWVFTGNSNTVDLLCSSLDSTTCETVTLDITTNGDSNVFNIYIGEVASADSLIAAFTVDGDSNTITANLDSPNADVTVTVDNTGSLMGGNTVNIDQDGLAGANGHSITYDITGGGNTVNITQSGLNDQTVSVVTVGDNQTIDITQSD